MRLLVPVVLHDLSVQQGDRPCAQHTLAGLLHVHGYPHDSGRWHCLVCGMLEV